MVVLDTHIVLAALGQIAIVLPKPMKSYLKSQTSIFVSVATLWELSIKHRLGKIGLSIAPIEMVELLKGLNIRILPVQAAHALADIAPAPRTKDPFDRLLLGVCAAENFKLVTLDRDLIDHPLTWRSFP